MEQKNYNIIVGESPTRIEEIGGALDYIISVNRRKSIVYGDEHYSSVVAEAVVDNSKGKQISLMSIVTPALASELEERCLRGGVYDYIVRPLHRDEMRQLRKEIDTLLLERSKEDN